MCGFCHIDSTSKRHIILHVSYTQRKQTCERCIDCQQHNSVLSAFSYEDRQGDFFWCDISKSDGFVKQ